MSSRKQARLHAYRELYGAICDLSESLYEQASSVCDDEREAALVASCSLIRTLGKQRDSTAQALLGRIARASCRRQADRGPRVPRPATRHACR